MGLKKTLAFLSDHARSRSKPLPAPIIANLRKTSTSCELGHAQEKARWLRFWIAWVECLLRKGLDRTGSYRKTRVGRQLRRQAFPVICFEIGHNFLDFTLILHSPAVDGFNIGSARGSRGCSGHDESGRDWVASCSIAGWTSRDRAHVAIGPHPSRRSGQSRFNIRKYGRAEPRYGGGISNPA